MISSPPIPKLAQLEDVARMRDLMRLSVLDLSKGFYSESQARSAAECLCVPDPDLIEDGTSYLVEFEGELAAVGAWSTRQKLYTGSEDQEALTDRVIPGLDAARIRAFFVHPSFVGRGLGRILYEACENAAIEMGFCQFELLATLPGVSFYERMGFEAFGEVEIVLTDGTTLPCRPMAKSLC